MSGNNVIVLMSDEHTRSVMGAYGNDLVYTPTLDKLAASGVRFDHAYTPSPICISARASFATGTQVFQHRCWSSAEPYYGQQQSWMHRLRDRGHEVVSIGKLHYRSATDDTGGRGPISQGATHVTATQASSSWSSRMPRSCSSILGRRTFPSRRHYARGSTRCSGHSADHAATDWLCAEQ